MKEIMKAVAQDQKNLCKDKVKDENENKNEGNNESSWIRLNTFVKRQG